MLLLLIVLLFVIVVFGGGYGYARGTWGPNAYLPLGGLLVGLLIAVLVLWALGVF